jgi:short-subunit dehydrogenase
MARREIKGAVVLVTGASSGVGWATAVALGLAGAKVCVTARRQHALEQLCAGLRARGVECLAVPGDVAVQADVERVVAACVERFGRIDVLVNNAAVQVYARFEDYTWDEITRTFDVTCFGYFRFARAVLPHFHRQGSGHLVNMLSMLSEGAAPLLSTYTACKHALYGWAQSLRLELWGSGIDVSNVLLPSVATPMFDHAPMKLGRPPRPIPPTYEPELGARAVLRCIRRPHHALVPVFLQGTLILWMKRWLPFVGELLLGRYGARLQMRPGRVDPAHGNLFEPVPEGVGPRGSVRATPRYLRYGATALLFAALGGATYGVVRAARAL